MTDSLGVLYRYDSYTSGEAATTKPFCQDYPVKRVTRCGVVLDIYGQEKFVLNGSAGKRFAYPTKEAALASFIRRKQRRLQHLAHAHDRELAALAVAKSMREQGLTEAPEDKSPRTPWHAFEELFS